MKKQWTCAVCTFAGNPIDHPVCKICGALPPTRPPTPEPKPQEPNHNKVLQMHQEQEKYLRELSKSHEIPQARNNSKKRDSLKTDTLPSIPRDDKSNSQKTDHKSSMIGDFDPLEAAHRNSISQIMVKDASRTSSSLVTLITLSHRKTYNFNLFLHAVLFFLFSNFMVIYECITTFSC